MSDPGDTLQSCVNRISKRTLAYKPGTHFNYSQRNHQVLAYYAQVVTGESWARLVEDRLLDPCGLDATAYVGIDRSDEADIDDPTNNPWVAGGLVSDLDDLAVFADLMLDGTCGTTTILSPGTLAAMRTDRVCGNVALGFSPFLLTSYHYGLSVLGDRCNWGTEPNLYSHPGAGGTIPWIDTGRDYTAVLFLDAGTSNGLTKGSGLWDDVRPLIAAQIDAVG